MRIECEWTGRIVSETVIENDDVSHTNERALKFWDDHTEDGTDYEYDKDKAVGLGYEIAYDKMSDDYKVVKAFYGGGA